MKKSMKISMKKQQKHRRMPAIKKCISFALSSVFMIGMLAGCGTASPANSGDGTEADEKDDDVGYVDSLTPATDFYGYINGKDLMNMSLSEKYQQRGSLDDVQITVDEQLDEIIDEIINGDDYEKGSYEQIIHDVYYLVLDTYSGNIDTKDKDNAIIEEALAKIEAPADTDELINMWHDLYLDYGVHCPIGAKISMNLKQNDEYIFGLAFESIGDLEQIKETDVGAVINRDSFADTLKIAGISADEANQRATEIVYALHDIASYTNMDIVNEEIEVEDYYAVYSADQLSDKLNNLSIDDLVCSGGYDVETPKELAIDDIGQWSTIDSLFDNEHLQMWKDMTICTFLNEYMDYIPGQYSVLDATNASVDKRARTYIKSKLDFVIGELYAKRHYSEEKRETITKMCEELKSEYYVLIDGADDISDEGKAFLKAKLDNMEFFIGADKPHEIDPSDGDFFDESLLQTMINFNKKKAERDLQQYGTVPEKNGFKEMASCTVNACYMPNLNSVNITAAITNYPIYDENADYYENLGRIGTVIGHEISHAFDSSGVKWDKDGNLNPEDFPEVDREAFNKKQQQAIDYYNKFTVLGSHVNGKLTLAENLADISGVQCCLAIAQTPENQQKVFENYAAVWCSLISDKIAKNYLETDVHAPDMIRINAVVSCFDEYYEIYGVKEGDSMFVAPEERIRRW